MFRLTLLTFILFNYLFSSTTLINEVTKNNYELVVDGQVFQVKGAAGEIIGVEGFKHLGNLNFFGGNTIRTWETTKEMLDFAEVFGIKVLAGIWVDHPRDGFDYNDQSFIEKQREDIIAKVKAFKNHPSLLAWGLGNEVENELALDGEDPTKIWSELNYLAKLIKNEDKNHPIVTAVAGLSREMLISINKYYPEIDILGVNAYGFAPEVGEILKEYNWNKPYMITEFGPVGFWEIHDITEWGAPIEETSHQKAERYALAQANALKNPSCLGTFPFMWGHKQEKTSTWFGMFLPDGQKLESVDEISKSWKGEYPKNRVPRIIDIKSEANNKIVISGSKNKAIVNVVNHNNHKYENQDRIELKYSWVIMDESKAESKGGEFEETPKSYPELIKDSNNKEIEFYAPDIKGAYRLFVYVLDNHNGAATANFPFYVD